MYDDFLHRIGTIYIENLNITSITLGSSQQINVIGTNELNVFPGCCGIITNISSLGNINVILGSGGQLNVTAISENVSLQITGGVIPYISVKANINTNGINTIYGKSSTSTMSANMTLNGISTVSIGVSNGTKIEYSCPKTITMTMEAACTAYVCATEKIYVKQIWRECLLSRCYE